MLAPVERYFRQHHVPFEPCPHPKAVTAQELAASLHVTGYQLAKPVVLNVDGELWLAAIPAPMRLDESKVAEALGAQSVRVASEPEFQARFPACEVGAEPPLGHLFGLPLIVDERLAKNDSLVFRAGTHEEAVRMRFADFNQLESPKIASITRPPVQRRWGIHWDIRDRLGRL